MMLLIYAAFFIELTYVNIKQFTTSIEHIFVEEMCLPERDSRGAPKLTASSVADFDGLSSAFAGQASSHVAAAATVLGTLLASALGHGR